MDAAAGWYPNPESTGMRWWDGSQWTDLTSPEAPPQAEPSNSAAHPGLPPRLPPLSHAPMMPPPPHGASSSPSGWRTKHTLFLIGFFVLLSIVSQLVRLSDAVTAAEPTPLVHTESDMASFRASAAELGYIVESGHDETIILLAEDFCFMADNASSRSQLDSDMLDVWDAVKESTKLTYRNDSAEWVAFMDVLMMTFCPDALEALS